MKYLLFTLSVLLFSPNFAQISIVGAKKTEITETNNDKKDVKEITDIKFTKTVEDYNKPSFVKKNTIENSKVNVVNEAIEINIIDSEYKPENGKNQIVLDLDKAKKTTDSLKNLNENTNLANENNTINSTNKSETLINQNAPIISSKPKEIIKQQSTAIITQEPKEIISSNVNIKEVNSKVDEINTKVPETENISTNPNAIISSKNESGIYFEPKKNTDISESEYLEFETEKNTSASNNKIDIKESNSITTSGNLNNLNNIEANQNLNNNIAENDSKEKDSKDANPKKGSWSMGLKAGIPAVIGDVNSRLGYGFSLNIQKAIGHVFALRFETLAIETKGLNNETINNTYHNYKTRFTDYTLQGVFNLNNLNFYKKEPKVLYNLAVGAGLATRYTWTDLVNETGVGYNYDNIPNGNASDISKAINEIRDNNYETSIAKDEDKMSIKNTNILPTIMLGLGIDIKLSEKIDLNLASRISHHFDDNLDGLKNGPQADWMTFTSLGLTYKFGSKNKSMLWSNPVYSKVEEINELKKKVDEGDLLKDEDKDGIADIFDQDLNTPAKVAVDSRGIASDMDKDGVPDYEDAEPFTPLGAQVNNRGIAIDTDNDGIADILDQEPNSLAGSQVDSRGKTIAAPRNTSNDLNVARSNSDFDLIFFDENSSNIKKEFYSDLYKISKYIQGNPSSKIEIVGYTDVTAGENYNLNLSERRANAVYKMLIEMFNVSSRNLVTRFEGEKNPIIEGLPKNKDKSLAAAYYINRRVEFKIIE